MIIRRQIADLFTNMMDAYSYHMRNHRFQIDFKHAARFLDKHPQPELTQQDKDAIDNYWKQFGIKYPDYTWHQMYYGVTGIHDPRFIPKMFAYPAIMTYYNDRSSIPGWEDKNLFEHLIPSIKFPTVLAHIYKGVVYDRDWNYCSDNQLAELCNSIYEEIKDDGALILKPTKATQQGKGVKLIEIKKPEDVLAIITQNDLPNGLMQRLIRQSNFMRQFCTTSVNIFRVITWRHKGKIDVLSTSIRYGIEGSHTDVAFVNGEEIVHTVGVNPDGTVNKRFINLDGNAKTPEHFSDANIPNLSAVIDMAKLGHKDLLPFDLVGWDITLDEGNEPVCIEYNIDCPGSILYQFANGPLAGDFTDEFLSFFLNDGFLEKNIPAKFRI